jgi:hypothetical protein
MKRALSALLLVMLTLLGGCANRQSSVEVDFQMGDRVSIGPLTYNVVETVWRSQLGELFRTRVPQQRFLVMTISVTNGGGGEVSVPLLQLSNANGQLFQELADGEGVDNWIGLLRSIKPAQTIQGRVLFDVPLSSYRLRLSNGSDAASERFAWVQIPLRIDADTPVEAPVPGAPPKQ